MNISDMNLSSGNDISIHHLNVEIMTRALVFQTQSSSEICDNNLFSHDQMLKLMNQFLGYKV